MDEIEMETQRQIADMKAAIKVRSQYYHLAFKTKSGKKVLELLDDMTTVQSSLCVNELMDADGTVTPEGAMYIREGQDQVIRYIKRMIKFYEEN